MNDSTFNNVDFAVDPAKSEYDIQAEQFLTDTGTIMSCKFDGFRKHFTNDEHARLCWKITLTRGNRSMEIAFGDSLQVTEKAINRVKLPFPQKGKVNYPAKVIWDEEQVSERLPRLLTAKWINDFAPSAYSVLACLTKHNPDTFENFCADYGYETYGKKTEKIYHAVKAEYQSLCTLFTDAEMELLAEIN